MKKSIIISLYMLAITFALQAQDEKLRIAVFDPTSSGTSIDEGTKTAVRELISSTFVNTGKYSIVERSLLDKVMKEQAFSNTDVVDESQATELGRLAGANKVVLSVVTLVGGRNMLSVKVIDVQTATVEQQKTKIVNSNDLLDVVEPLTLELMGEKASTETIGEPSNSVSVQTRQQPSNIQTQPIAAANAGGLNSSGRKVYQNSVELSKYEVRRLMTGTDALQYYNSGMFLNLVGNISVWSGAGLALVGIVDFAIHGEYSSGLSVAGLGVIITGGGYVLKVISKSSVKKAVNRYNSNHTAMELDFGFTGNGVRLAFRF